MTTSAYPSSAASRGPVSKRRVLSIEEALRWALRDEIPKRRFDQALGSAPSMPSIHPMWANGLFTRVDNWSREPGMPLAMGECHPDADRIEAAITALNPESLDLTPYRIGHGLGPGCDLDHVIAMVRRDVDPGSSPSPSAAAAPISARA